MQKRNHREFRDDEFWKRIPGFAQITREEFADHRWQLKNSLRKISQVATLLGNKVSEKFMKDLEEGQRKTPMNIRITPYIFSLINWDAPLDDPLRKQFLPVGSQFLEDHPFYLTDSLAEDTDSPVPLLTHRYPDKVLFLPTTICPVYCSYCTRSRLVGGTTESVEKETYGANEKKWEAVFEYLKKHKEIEDVVISGGDAFMLTPEQIKKIGHTLLNIEHIRRLRYATKGIAIFPQKILTDEEWFKAFLDVFHEGKKRGKSVFIHTHFSNSQEITLWTKLAMDRLFSEGVFVRNQAVLQAGVNDSPEEMIFLTRQLSYLNINPYYVYLHDMVPGCEHLRTSLELGENLEKTVRGATAGFNTPTFVCDLPGGGGKRHIASYEYYDKETGISLWRSPTTKPGKVFAYFDPLYTLSPLMQKRWRIPEERKWIIEEAEKKSGLSLTAVYE